MFTTESGYSPLDLEFSNNYIGLVYLLPRLLCLVFFTVIVIIMTTDTPFKKNNILGVYIIPIIDHLKNDGAIIDIFLMTCLNSALVVLGSQWLVKALLDDMEIKIHNLTAYYATGYILDLICEICLFLSYLALRNVYIM